MKKAIEATQKTFESSSSKTPEYIDWHRLFKREFRSFLDGIGAEEVFVSRPNHFDMSGFFKKDGQCWYFRIEDLRWAKQNMLVRTAESYEDYTGGVNQYVPLNKGADVFAASFAKIVG